ncbi:hypothetical protein E3C22_10110 [Jiella endophytica]|uniref:Uncharacterized protein n=1 Tax=Jiella endophytica TaxID=2558362 RepID=A0A4Y8RKZ1_9HYPH|nr:hypothetical protein [Jiella endophytica]TFF22813.1 hypothetical protein E3C22_10110 [Jiella endophytica]
MRNIDKIYVASGFGWLIFSAGFGTWLGASGHFNFAESHAHIGLLGFVASLLFGLVHRCWPELRQRLLSTIQFAVYEIGTIVLLAGKIMVDATGTPNLLLMIGAPIVIVGVLLFLWLFLASPEQKRTPELVPAE